MILLVVDVMAVAFGVLDNAGFPFIELAILVQKIRITGELNGEPRNALRATARTYRDRLIGIGEECGTEISALILELVARGVSVLRVTDPPTAK